MRATLLALLVVLAVAAASERMMRVAVYALPLPSDLASETPNVTTIRIIQEGLNPYDPGVYDAMPFALTQYTPLFHYAAAGLPVAEGNPFLAGRALSLAALAACTLLLFVVARGRLLVPGMAVAVWFLNWPITMRAAFVRVDHLALLFAAGAVVCLAGAARSHRRLALSALLCVLALATKQSYLAAPVACFVYLLTTDRRSSWIFAAWGAVLGGAFVAFATIAWGPGFWFSTVVATNNVADLANARLQLMAMMRQPVFVWLAVAGLVGLVVMKVTAAGRERRPSPYPAYASSAWVLLLSTLWKTGSDTHYFHEPIFALLLCLVHAGSGLSRAQLTRGLPLAACSTLLVAVAFEVATARPEDYSLVDDARRRYRQEWQGNLRQAVADMGYDDPKVLCFKAYTLNYIFQDLAYVNDGFLYRLLWDRGVLSPDPLIAEVEARTFDLIIMKRRVAWSEGSAAVDRLDAAIRKHYRVGGRFVNLFLLQRRYERG